MTNTPRLLALGLLSAMMLSACPKASAPPASDSQAEPAAEAASDRQATITLAPEGEELIGLQTQRAAIQTLASALSATGEVVANSEREAHVTTRVPGRVIRIVRTVGDRVAAGETLAIIESVELGQAQSDYLQAESRYALAKSQYERQRALYRNDLAAEKEVQATQNQLRLAQIDLEKSINQLQLLGYDASRHASLRKNRRLDPTIPLTAPIAGTIVARHLTLGEMLESGAPEPAFTISDTSSVWVMADVYEKDLARIAVGQPAAVTTAAYPNKRWSGKVSLIGTSLDKASRTAKVRVSVANADHKLKPEMFATVTIDAGTQQALAVPRTAVQEEGKKTFVYRKTGPHQYVEQAVTLGSTDTTFVAVTAGLKAGDEIVSKGSFDLKAQARKDAFGEDE